jgi:CheY-like chemotaxis protein
MNTMSDVDPSATGGVLRPLTLLVDDSPDIRRTIGRFLEVAGFEVVQASSGIEALTLLTSGQKFALLVTDYAMPGLNGAELATQALQQLPALKILIITGFPTDASLVNPSNVAMLEKPFSRATLIACLKSLLDKG